MVIRVSEQLNTQNTGASIQSMWGTGSYNAKVYNLVGDGTTNDYTKLYNLINTTINGAEATIIFPKGTYKISSNITIPSNISLYFVKGAMLSPDSGVTVTINGPVEAGLRQIFTGSGTITGGFDVEYLHPEWWGVVADGATNDYIKFNAACDAAIASGIPLKLPNKTIYIGTGIDKTGALSVVGSGETSVIKSGDTTKSILKVTNAHGSTFRDFKVLATASSRNSTQYGFLVYSSNRVKVENVQADGTAAAGIFISLVTDSQITKCDVRNNYADGIHITNQCKDLTVSNNNTYNTGDDGIAVVSYQSDTGYNERIVISSNTVENAKARGISHVGGKNVIISQNIISGTASSGILVNKDATYSTYEPNDTIIEGNQILNAGQVTPRVGNQFGIEVTTDAVRTKIGKNLVKGSYSRGISSTGTKVSIIDNDVISNGNDGINVANDTGAVVEGNRIEENVGYGLYANTIRNGSFNGNQLLNNNTAGTAGVDNAHFVSCSYGEIIGNTSADNRGTKLIETTFDINACSEMKISGNIDDAGGGTRVMTFNAGCSNIWIIEGIIGSYVPTTNIHATGQIHWDPAGNKFYMYNGTAWKSTTLA